MADTDGTLDHRAELMRKWSADKALMAQAGLLSQFETPEATFLGVKTTEAILKKRRESEEKRKAAVTDTPVTHTTNHKKSNHKKSETAKALSILQNLTEKKHKKNKTNGHIHSAETVEQLDAKIGLQLTKYKEEITQLMTELNEIQSTIPTDVTLKAIKGCFVSAISTIRKFAENSITFEQAYFQLANNIFKYVHNTSWLKQIKYSYAYPAFFNWPSEIITLQKGFLIHHLLGMTLNLLQKNTNSEYFKATEVKTGVHDAIHVILTHKRQLDKTFTVLHNLKEGLDTKTKAMKKENKSVNLKHIKHLKEDIEETLHHNGSFYMAQPFE
jgi:hypothetical protein